VSSPFPLRKTNFPDSFFPLTTPQRGDFSAKDAPSLDKSAVYDMLNRYEISRRNEGFS
jgi:hypothetical protein